jgi:hypothetical protein
MDCHKCKFCDSIATSKYRLYVGNKPTEREGFISWRYFGEAIYVCDMHIISHNKCDMGEKLITDQEIA